MNRATLWAAAGAVLLCVAAPTVAMAQAKAPAVSQVFVVDVEPKNVDDYLGRLAKAQAIIKGLGLPGFQVLQASMAGPNTGQIAVVVESDSLASLAANQGKLQASAEWQKWVEEQQESELGDVVSNSIWVDVTP
jgi:hypothetical protein